MEDVRMGKSSTPGHRPSPSVRRYSPEFKQDAVALLNSSGRSVAAVAKEVGVSDGALAAWARAQAAGLSAEDRAAAQVERKEAIELHKRIGELEQEVEILKRFTASWIREEGEK
jgi:transposase